MLLAMSQLTRRHTEIEALADILWTERHLLERLLFRVSTVRLLLAADERRFVAAAIDEVETAIAELTQAEAQRERALRPAATALGLRAEELSLQHLATHAPSPFDLVFRDHQREITAMVDEIHEVASHNARLVSSTLGYIDRSMRMLDDRDTTTYSGDGTGAAGAVRAGVRLDRRM
jgi:hypothetical protein